MKTFYIDYYLFQLQNWYKFLFTDIHNNERSKLNQRETNSLSLKWCNKDKRSILKLSSNKKYDIILFVLIIKILKRNYEKS